MCAWILHQVLSCSLFLVSVLRAGCVNDVYLDLTEKRVGDEQEEEYEVKQGQFFCALVNCNALMLSANESKERKSLDGMRTVSDVSAVYGYARATYRNRVRICTGTERRGCKCFNLRIISSANIRSRRASHDSHLTYNCPSSQPVTEGIILLDLTYSSLSTQQRTELISQMATYANVTQGNVSVRPGQGMFYTSDLSKARLTGSGSGDAGGRVHSTTLLKYLISCSSISLGDDRLHSLKLDAASGKLSGVLRYPIAGWYIVAGCITTHVTTKAPMRYFKQIFLLSMPTDGGD